VGATYNAGAENNPSWMQGHIYIIDFFLWFMAARGTRYKKPERKGSLLKG